MADEVLIHSRAEVFGDALPRTTAGALRPRLAANRRTLTVHYVGSGTFTDAGDTISEIQAIERWASSPAKGSPWEYNWVVDSAGEIWTYAGEFVAAHSAGNNTTAIGVLMLAGATDLASDAMVLGLRKLRWMLQQVGLLAEVHQLLPHRQMPGAVTQCPGPAVLARWGDIAEPWAPPAPIVTPEDEMQIRYRDRRYHNIWLVGAAPALNLSGELDAYFAGKGLELVEGEHDQMLRGLMLQSGLSASDLVPR